jgi:putative thiamine transport system permease protein
MGVLFGCSLGSLLGLALWSLAGRWRFPDALPQSWSLANWRDQLAALAQPSWTTLAVGLAATAVAVVLVAGCLENESRRQQRPGAGALALLYMPLLVPQISFLFGVQVLFLWLGLNDGWLAVIWSHLLFVLPYVFLTLADPYRSLDPRFERIALALGKPPWLVWLRIKLVMLLRPLLIAMAVGFAVSVAQFLPTLFAGGGRFGTLATETLSLSGGGDRRIIGRFGFALAALPFCGFALALAVSAWRFRRRRAMWVGA